MSTVYSLFFTAGGYALPIAVTIYEKIAFCCGKLVSSDHVLATPVSIVVSIENE